jgi:hypothetical protein
METKRIERLCNIIDYCILKIFDNNTPVDSHIGWYNHFNNLLDEEIKNDLNMNVDDLKISSLTKTTIKRMIETEKMYQKFWPSRR